MIVPKQFFVPSIIEKRKPLAETARRAGWTGCNILLSRIPQEGKIFIVRDRVPQSRDSIQDQWRKSLFLRDTSLSGRGWILDVWSCVLQLARDEFTLDEVYAFETKLKSAWPGNDNVRPKIRQQLQFLRDRGKLEFLGGGRYRLTRS